MRADIKERINYLTEKLTNGEDLSGEEFRELNEFLSRDPRLRQEFESRVDPALLEELTGVYLRANSNWEDKLEEVITRRKTVRMNRWKVYSASAALFILLVSGILLISPRFKRQDGQVIVSQDLQPGGNKAILTLADGRSVVLDSAKNGALAQQGGSRIVKLKSGQLAYKSESFAPAIGYNTISTPRGGTYQITLPDGSRAWLNAESTIRFPTAFGSASREVTITGEAYFEIVKDPRRPFRVVCTPLTISVLGTSFNIRSYQDENARATLTSGAVRISRGEEEITLKPGEQAVAASSLKMAPDVDLESVTAWRENLFTFNHSTIKEVMSELSRWYDVEVSYEGGGMDHKITAILRRDALASKNLEILKMSGYKFRIQGRTIVVLSN